LVEVQVVAYQMLWHLLLGIILMAQDVFNEWFTIKIVTPIAEIVSPDMVI
jgi:hypothetical protein